MGQHRCNFSHVHPRTRLLLQKDSENGPEADFRCLHDCILHDERRQCCRFLFGWNSMDRLFLGGMLAMSSTTIIYKAFDDLALRSQKFSSEVLSVLVLEDILGILLMVVLSAMAVSRTFEGAQLLGNLLQLSFFLIIWFVVGVYVVPTFLRKSGKWINDETLLIVAIGLCFMLVVMASKAGYSSAFGAFMMGSILAETTEAENVERVVKPLKNLFGAIFSYQSACWSIRRY